MIVTPNCQRSISTFMHGNAPRLDGRHILNPTSPRTTRSADVAASPRDKSGEVRHTHLGGSAMSDLLGYPHEETAEKVWDELVQRALAVIGANVS